MTHTTLDLQKMGLTALSPTEAGNINGGGDGLIFPMGTGGSDPAEAGAATISAVRALAEAKGVWDFLKWTGRLLE